MSHEDAHARRQTTIDDLMKEVGAARAAIAKADESRLAKLDQLQKDIRVRGRPVGEIVDELDRIVKDQGAEVARLQRACDSLSLKIGRPRGGAEFSEQSDQAAARGLLELKHLIAVPKHDPMHPFNPSPEQIEEAAVAVKAVRHLFKTTSIEQLDLTERKALTSFNLGSNGFLLPPEMSDKVLSCLVDPTDLSGLVGNVAITSPSVRFLVDNAQVDQALWACETDCWSATHIQNLAAGLGELEIKPETLRYIICASRDLLEDASTNVETWLLNKVNVAVRSTLSAAIVSGDGIGKPQGILHSAAHVPICETSGATPAGQFTWQDIIMLKWQVPMQWHAQGSYLMNQITFAMCLTMSDAMGRPLMIANPTEAGTFLINGSPVRLATQMPDIAPGSIPVAFGNWQQAYTLVNRKAVTMMPDPYSAGFCVVFKFEARVGGAMTCPNAARLLRIQ